MKGTKRILCVMLSLALTLAMPITPASAAKKKAPKLNKSKLTLTVGKTAKLKVKNTKQKIKWSSSKKSVATVNKKGKVTAKKAGKTTITAKVGKKKLKCKVTVNPKKANTKATPKPTQKPSTGTTTPAETAVKIASLKVKDELTVEVTLSMAQALTKENFSLKAKRYANGKYLKTFDIDDVKSNDQKTYVIHINVSKYINLLDHVQVTVSGLKVTGTATAETVYTVVVDITDEQYLLLKTGEELPYIDTIGRGYANILSKKLPEGIGVTLENGVSFKFSGTFTTTGKKEGTIVYEDELGSKYTIHIVWIVGSNTSIVVETNPSYGMVQQDTTKDVESSFYIAGGSGNYTYSIVDESYQDIVSVDGENQSMWGDFASGSHNVNIKVTDAEDEDITTTFTWKVDIKTGKDVTVTVKDANGNIIEDDTVYVYFENQNKSDLYCSFIDYGVQGETVATIMEGTYDVTLEHASTSKVIKNVVISATTTTLEFSLPVYKVTLTSNLDLGNAEWYDSQDMHVRNGNILLLENGKYSLTGTVINGIKMYNLKVDVTVSNANTTAAVTIVSESSRNKGVITVGTPQSVEIDLEYVYYSFTPESDGTYCFYSTSEDDVDTYGELLNSEFITMMQNDDTNGYQFEIVQELEAGETYYIGIRSFGEELTAQLHVDKI